MEDPEVEKPEIERAKAESPKIAKLKPKVEESKAETLAAIREEKKLGLKRET